MVQRGRRRQPLELFNDERFPVRDVSRQELERCGRALAAPQGERISDFRPGTADLRRHPMQLAMPDEVANVRHHPVRAGLDKLVVV
jgi:hypothetical protein